MTSDLYDDYRAFKGWTDEGAGGDAATYANIVAASGKPGTLALLELGFGDGSFMDWAKAAGHEIAGLEIIPEARDAVAARGHEAYLDGDEIAGRARFDAIIAIDVLEHLDAAGFRSLFDLARRVLKDDGVIVGRFPNGASPFFGRYQYGDMTHDKPLSAGSVGQIALRDGFRVVRALNPRPLPAGAGARLKRGAAYLLRDMVEIVLGLAYFGYRSPMDPNVLVVLGRAPGEGRAPAQDR
jgi:SAM-dependent methyltransferase